MAKQDFNLQGVKLSNMKNLIEWIKQSNLDPYDPDNAILINLIKVGGYLNEIVSKIADLLNE